MRLYCIYGYQNYGYEVIPGHFYETNGDDNFNCSEGNRWEDKGFHFVIVSMNSIKDGKTIFVEFPKFCFIDSKEKRNQRLLELGII